MLIIGRKGSGKSAICMQLMADGEGGHRGGKVLVTPDEAAGKEIRRFELQGLPGDSAKALIWRYVFAVHAARYLVEHAKGAHHGGHKTDSVKVLARFLKQNGEAPGGGGGRLVDRVAQGARRLQTSLSLEALGMVKASVDLAQSPSEGARATRRLEIVEQGVVRAFADLGCDGVVHPPLLLMVDQLEQVWSAEPDSNSMVIGLLLAAKHAASLYGRFCTVPTVPARRYLRHAVLREQQVSTETSSGSPGRNRRRGPGPGTGAGLCRRRSDQRITLKRLLPETVSEEEIPPISSAAVCPDHAMPSSSSTPARRRPGWTMNGTGSGQLQPGASGSSFVNRDDRLLRQVARSCHSILAQVGRAVALTRDVRDEITTQINRVLDEVNRVPPGAAASVGVDVDDYLLTTAHYFTTLAAQLRSAGLEESTGHR